MNFIANKRDKIFSGSLPHQPKVSDIYIITIIIITIITTTTTTTTTIIVIIIIIIIIITSSSSTETSNTLDFFSEFTRFVMQGDLIFTPSFYYVHK
jgi:hypothetical protein